jgi:alpha-beta hydrolase superfamily lysophospholipase
MNRYHLLQTYTALLGRSLDKAAYTDGFVTSADGTRLFYRSQRPSCGSPSDDRVVLVLHGISWHSAPYFAVFAHYLVPLGLTVVALDVRGHGLSGGQRGDMESPAKVLADIDAMLQRVRTEHPHARVFLAGKSMGGLFALAYVARYQSRLAGLVLVSPGLLLHPRQVLQRQTIAEAVRAILHPGEGVIDMVGPGLDALSRGTQLPEMRRTDTLALESISLRYLLVLARVNALWPLRYPRRIRVPTLILQGLADQALLPSGATILFRLLAASEKKLVTFPQMNHNLLWDVDTPLVFDEVSRWLKAH